MARVNMSRSRIAWWVLGGLFAVVVGLVIASFIGTVVFGLFIYYGTRPIYRQIRRALPWPSITAALSLLVLTLPVLFLLVYAVVIATRDLHAIVRTIDFTPAEGALEPYVDGTGSIARPETLLTADNLGTFQDVLGSTLEYLGVIGTGLLHVFIMFVIAFYLLRDDHRLDRWLHARFDDESGAFAAYLAAVDRDLHNIFFGNLVNMVLTGTIAAITYGLLNVYAPAGQAIPRAALLGLITGAASLIPVVGMKIVYVPVAGLLFGRSFVASGGLSADPTGQLWFPAVFLLVSVIIVDFIPDLLLRPYVSGRDLHTGLVMLSYILGPLLFGWYGIFLGPVILVFVVNFVDLILPDLTSGREISPPTLPPSTRTLGFSGPSLGGYSATRPDPAGDVPEDDEEPAAPES